MKKLTLLLLFVGLMVNISCGISEKDDEQKVQLETEFGIVKIKLYNETPLHRDNFIKLTKEGFYTDLLFHRVINNFMIQGGDPDSKNAPEGKALGSGDLGYTIQAEINPKFFHRKGVLAAARTGDNINPERRSSASQFYILHGKIFRPGELDTMELKLEEQRKQSLLQAKARAIEEELKTLSNEGKQDELMARVNGLKLEVEAEIKNLPSLKLTPEQRTAYTTIGGYPSLDNNYTIFGEVIEGIQFVDSIAKQPVGERNRPIKDIKFTIKYIK